MLLRTALLCAVLAGTAGAEGVLSVSPQARPETIPRAGQGLVRGRLVDENNKPITDAVLRPCRQATKPDGSRTTSFAMYTDGTWATTRTDQTGAFVFDRELPLGNYCLAIESRRELSIMKAAGGGTFQFEVSAKAAQVDLGLIVLR
ncbi:MAG: hypothetical protein WD690_00870 [Vicinamibacterales bacterium]